MKIKNEVVKNAQRLLINQLIIGVVISLGFWMKGSSWQVWSALYGMGASIAITALLSYGVVRAEKAAANDPKKSMGILYVGAVQRFLLVLGLFIFGLAVLKLEPLATAVSFGLTQFGYVFNFAQLKKNSI